MHIYKITFKNACRLHAHTTMPTNMNGSESKVHCTGRSAFRVVPGVSGIPYYCAPFVCVPDVIGVLAVWQL